MRVIGLDVGGANLKASDGEHRSRSRPFALWKAPEHLGRELQALLGEFARLQHLAVTMTGELADCFESKAEGVDRILTAIEAAVDVPVHVWQRGGEFVSTTDARKLPMLVAAANWHALATWAARMTPAGVGLLIDVGSTTTDIIPLIDGLPANVGGADLERLASGELVYTGARRTPVCAVTRSVFVNGHDVPLAAELFATMHDVALILGHVVENPTHLDTADGRPATIEYARHRLARMHCCDRTEITDAELREVASQVCDVQQRQLRRALQCVLQRLPQAPGTLLLSGEGEHVARRVVDLAPSLADCERVCLRESLGPDHSAAACAFALARLGTERIR